MSARKRVFTALAALAFSMSPAVGCQLDHPTGYVPPTLEDLISKSRAAFIGHVIGYRLDDGTTIDQDIDCQGDVDFLPCWDKRMTIVSAILAVDVDIRGMGDQRLFEDERSAEPGADCGNYYADGVVFLVTGFGPEPLNRMPSADTIRAWQALPFREAN